MQNSTFLPLQGILAKIAFLFLLFATPALLMAQSLREIASSKGKFIGNAVNNGFLNNPEQNNGNYTTVLSTEYNVMVCENAMKMDALLPNRPVDPFNVTVNDINKTNIDKFVAYAELHNMRTRGHAMIWYAQAPQWLLSEVGGWSSQQIYDFSRTYITALSTYCIGKIDEWDVLNEVFDDNAGGFRTGAWYQKVNTEANNSGQIGYYEYIKSLFVWARNADPNAKLFYNDYSIEQFGTAKNNAMRTMVKNIKNETGAIDGVGFQSHFQSGLSAGFISSVGQSIDDLGNAGLEVALTELDLRRCNSQSTDAIQRTSYRDLVLMALSKSNCKSVLIWGVFDGASWIPAFFSGCGLATLHDDNFQKKQAYFGVKDALEALGQSNTTYTVRARGTSGTEQIQLIINGQIKTTWTLGTSMAEYTFSSNSGTARVQFINDAASRDVQVDYLKINNTILQSEIQPINTGRYGNGQCGGGPLSEWMYCNGYIEYHPTNTFTVRARGNIGGEQIELRLNNVVKATWTLSSTYADYTFTANESGTVRVAFINDGTNKDVYVDYLQKNSTIYQSEDQAINTGLWSGTCGGGGYSEIMHCNGYIEYSGSNNLLRVENTQSKFTEKSLTIYPNPAQNGQFSLTLPPDGSAALVRIWNTRGQLIQQLSTEGQSMVPVSLSAAPGLYLIEVDQNQTRVFKKVMVF